MTEQIDQDANNLSIFFSLDIELLIYSYCDYEGHNRLDAMIANNIFTLSRVDAEYIMANAAHYSVQHLDYITSQKWFDVNLRSMPSYNKLSPNNLFRQMCICGNIKGVKYLQKHFDIDVTDFANEVIWLASKHGHIDIVKYLCTLKGIDPTRRDCLGTAAVNKRYDVVIYLLKHPRNASIIHRSKLLADVAVRRDFRMFNILANHRESCTSTLGDRVISKWVKQNDRKMITAVLTCISYDLTKHSDAIIKRPILYGDIQMIELCIKHPTINLRGISNHLVKTAAKNGWTSITKLLHEYALI